MIESPLRIDRQVVYGVLFVVLVGALIAGTVAQYRGAFEDNVDITLQADRAGLTLAKGAPIKLHGVEVGKVGSVTTDGSNVTIGLEIDAGSAAHVPSDVTAQVVPPTAFGAKYVQLTPAGTPAVRAIAAGDIIPATRVTVEVNEAFENLTHVLDAARPADVDAALTAAAGAIDQRGALLNDLIRQTDTYLVGFNPALPALSRDLATADDVLDVYDQARPALVKTLNHTATISNTLVRRHASLRALELSLTTFSDKADMLLRTSADGIFSSLSLMEPVSRTLERYSPELPCIVLGLTRLNTRLEAAFGGTNPGLSTYTRLVLGRAPYTHPKNLPLLGEDRGPVCFGLPDVSQGEAEQTPPVMQTGANPYADPQSPRQPTTLGGLLGALTGER